MVNYCWRIYRLYCGSDYQKGGAMGIIANIIAGLLGSSVGQALFGTWGQL